VTAQRSPAELEATVREDAADVLLLTEQPGNDLPDEVFNLAASVLYVLDQFGALANQAEEANARLASIGGYEGYSNAWAEVERRAGEAEARVALLEDALREAEAERDDAISCLQRVVEADRDDSRMGHPNAGDSCIGACIGLDVMPWLDARGKLLPFVPRAAAAPEKKTLGGFIPLPTKRQMGVDAPDFGPTLGSSAAGTETETRE
jgi:hypothetical protein